LITAAVRRVPRGAKLVYVTVKELHDAVLRGQRCEAIEFGLATFHHEALRETEP
jgi:hypothetical protein